MHFQIRGARVDLLAVRGNCNNAASARLVVRCDIKQAHAMLFDETFWRNRRDSFAGFAHGSSPVHVFKTAASGSAGVSLG
jgi:hypothetical protein